MLAPKSPSNPHCAQWAFLPGKPALEELSGARAQLVCRGPAGGEPWKGYGCASPSSSQVVDLVRKSGNAVTLLVLDGESYEKAIKKRVDLQELGRSPEERDSDAATLAPVVSGTAGSCATW